MIDGETIREAVERLGSQRAAAKELGIPRSTLQGRLKREEPHLESAGDALGFPVEGVSSYWVKTKGGSYHVKRPQGETLESLTDAVKETLQDCRGIFSAPALTKIDRQSDVTTFYPLADLHVGMLAWAAETGQDWDLKLAEEIIVETFAKLVEQAQPSKYALIVNLGDYFHGNDSSNATPRSKHVLDVDSRHSKAMLVGVRIFKKLIDIAASKHEFLEIRNVKGNHDEDSSDILTAAFWLAYDGDKRITVDPTPKQLSYYEWGNNLLGFFHGHTMKADRAAMAMPCEVPQAWGRTKYRHIWHGHFHSTMAKEIGSVIVEGLPTIIPRDAYAASHGYSSGRSLSAIAYHIERGEIGRHKVNL